MAKEKIKLINKFSGGMVRDDKSAIVGASSNLEEIDIFANADYIQAEQIMSAYSLPATTEVYAYTSATDGTVYGYGAETGAGKVRILSVASGAGTAPSTLSTLFTSADTTNLAYTVSPIQYFKTSEASAVYFIKGTGSTWYLSRYSFTSSAEERWTGSAWSSSGSPDASTQLTEITGSFDRISMKVVFGQLLITNGKYITKVDKDGVVTLAALTLPREWISVDICSVSDVCIILSRYTDRTVNYARGYWWDTTNPTTIDDSFNLPSGGPQWILNHKETIKICTAINGTAKFYQLSGAFPGSVPVELPGVSLNNVAIETATQPISAPKCVTEKDRILYFGMWKTDKSGIYAIGQIDSGKPIALLLSKRFNTTDYSLHKPTAVFTLGPNFFASYYDNGTSTSISCFTLNSPSRSSTGIYESIIIDDSDPLSYKKLEGVYVASYPLPASTSINAFVQSDYGSYAQVYRGDASSFNTSGACVAWFQTPGVDKKRVFKIKAVLVSSTSTSPKLTAIGIRLTVGSAPSTQ